MWTFILMYSQALTPHAGTSIGSLIGGLYAREGDLLSTSGRAKQFSGRMGNFWRILSDVTYPIVAYTTVRGLSLLPWGGADALQGHEFNRSIYKVWDHLFACPILLTWHLGLLRPSHRGYVASFLLQHNQHYDIPHGNTWDWIRVALYSWVQAMHYWDYGI